jgi:hypothetical protein
VKKVFSGHHPRHADADLEPLCGAKKCGTMTPVPPFPFLREIPPDLLESSDAKAKEPVSVETGKNLFAAMRLVLLC